MFACIACMVVHVAVGIQAGSHGGVLVENPGCGLGRRSSKSPVGGDAAWFVPAEHNMFSWLLEWNGKGWRLFLLENGGKHVPVVAHVHKTTDDQAV